MAQVSHSLMESDTRRRCFVFDKLVQLTASGFAYLFIEIFLC